jgi:Fungal Zn(2)-Cys(6) binuclear cluster domain
MDDSTRNSRHFQGHEVPKPAPAKRQQVARACKRCASYKRKCSGTIPCERCVRLQVADTCEIVMLKRTIKSNGDHTKSSPPQSIPYSGTLGTLAEPSYSHVSDVASLTASAPESRASAKRKVSRIYAPPELYQGATNAFPIEGLEYPDSATHDYDVGISQALSKAQIHDSTPDSFVFSPKSRRIFSLEQSADSISSYSGLDLLLQAVADPGNVDATASTDFSSEHVRTTSMGIPVVEPNERTTSMGIPIAPSPLHGQASALLESAQTHPPTAPTVSSLDSSPPVVISFVQGDFEPDLLMPYPAWRITFSDAAAQPQPSSTSSAAPAKEFETIVCNRAGAALFNVACEDCFQVASAKEPPVWMDPSQVRLRWKRAKELADTRGTFYEFSGTYLRSVSQFPENDRSNSSSYIPARVDETSLSEAQEMKRDPGASMRSRYYSVFTAKELVFLSYYPSGAVKHVLSLFSSIEDADIALSEDQLEELKRHAQAVAVSGDDSAHSHVVPSPSPLAEVPFASWAQHRVPVAPGYLFTYASSFPAVPSAEDPLLHKMLPLFATTGRFRHNQRPLFVMEPTSKFQETIEAGAFIQEYLQSRMEVASALSPSSVSSRSNSRSNSGGSVTPLVSKIMDSSLYKRFLRLSVVSPPVRHTSVSTLPTTMQLSN